MTVVIAKATLSGEQKPAAEGTREIIFIIILRVAHAIPDASLHSTRTCSK